MRFFYIFFLISIFSTYHFDAHASCGTLTLSIPSPVVSWSESYISQQEDFTFSRSNAGSCTTFASFSAGGAGSGNYSSRRAVHTSDGSKQISYQLYKVASLLSSRILREPPNVTSNNQVVLPSPGFSGGASSRTGTYYIEVPQASATSPTVAKAGQYQDTFTVKVYDGNFSSGTVDNSYNVTITINVPIIARLSLVDSGGAFNASDTSQTLNFGSLVTNATLGFDMRAVTNAGYEIKFSSQNDGVMKHTNPSVTTTIPYTASVNGNEQSLVGSASVPISMVSVSGQTSLSGANNPVVFKIGDASNKVAGSYSDNITVTMATID